MKRKNISQSSSAHQEDNLTFSSQVSSLSEAPLKKQHIQEENFDNDLKRSGIVKISATTKSFDYSSPWATPIIEQSVGTGFIIEGKMIVTNGHVVGNNVYLRVQLDIDDQEYDARLLHRADICDLAILTVDNPEFWEKAHVNPLGTLPPLRTEINVYGFPMGGDKIAINSGKITRIDFGEYAHSYENLLVVQIDAAINPGNSGGPVFHGDKVIGIVHQGLDSGQNLGYCIPVGFLKNILEQVKTFGHFKGIVDFDIKTQHLKNPFLREKIGIKDDEHGVLIKSLSSSNYLYDLLKNQDVIKSVDGYKISGNGTVRRFGTQLNYEHLFHEKKPGDQVLLEIVRNGQPQSLNITLKTVIGESRLVSPINYDKKPSYFIYAGFVFTKLTTNYLESAYGGLFDSVPAQLKIFEKTNKNKKREEVVLISSKLNSKINEGYCAKEIENQTLSQVEYTLCWDKMSEKKKIKVKSLKQLAKILADDKVTELTFHLENKEIVVLPRLSAAEQKEILRNYDIDHDRSDDLKEKPSDCIPEIEASNLKEEASSSDKSDESYLCYLKNSGSEDEFIDPPEQSHSDFFKDLATKNQSSTPVSSPLLFAQRLTTQDFEKDSTIRAATRH